MAGSRTEATGDPARIRRPRARRARNSLTLEEIVDGAIELVRADGLSALSIRAVAARVGAAPMAVYTHLGGRAELELAMLERVVGEIDTRASGADTRARLTVRFRSLHDHFVGSRWALPLLVRGDLVPVSSFAFADACIGDFLALGMSPADAVYAYGVSWHLALGEILDRHPDGRSDPGASQRAQALGGLDATAFPNYSHVIAVLDPDDAPPPCQFERSFGVLLDGLVMNLPRSDPE